MKIIYISKSNIVRIDTILKGSENIKYDCIISITKTKNDQPETYVVKEIHLTNHKDEDHIIYLPNNKYHIIYNFKCEKDDIITIDYNNNYIIGFNSSWIYI